MTKLAEEIGLDVQQFREALQTKKYKQVHRQALDNAYRKKIRSVPTFIIGETVIEGIRSKETFEEVINDEINKQKQTHLEGLYCGIDGCK